MKAALSSIFCISFFILLVSSFELNAASPPTEIVECEGANRQDYLSLAGERPIKANYRISFEQNLNAASPYTNAIVEFDDLKSNKSLSYHDLGKTLLDGLPVEIDFHLLGADAAVVQTESITFTLTGNSGRKKVAHKLRSPYSECGIDLRTSMLDWAAVNQQMKIRFDNLMAMENCLSAFANFERQESLLQQVNANKINQQVEEFVEMRKALDDYSTINKSGLVKLRSGSNYPSVVELNRQYNAILAELFEAYMDKGDSYNSNSQSANSYYDAAAKLPFKSAEALSASFDRYLQRGKMKQALETLELLDDENFPGIQNLADQLFEEYRINTLTALEEGSLDRARKMALDAKRDFCASNILFNCHHRFDALLEEVDHYAYDLKFAEFNDFVQHALMLADQHQFDSAIREIDLAMEFAERNKQWNLNTSIAIDALVHIYCVEIDELDRLYPRLTVNERLNFLEQLDHLERKMFDRGIEVRNTSCYSGFLHFSEDVYLDMLQEAERLLSIGQLESGILVIERLEILCDRGLLPCDEGLVYMKLKTKEARYFELLDLANYQVSQTLFADATNNFKKASLICENYGEIECQTIAYSNWIRAELSFGKILSQRNQLGKAFVHFDEAYRLINKYHPAEEGILHQELMVATETHTIARLNEMQSDLQNCLAKDDNSGGSRVLKNMNRLATRYGANNSQVTQLLEEGNASLKSKKCLDEQEYWDGVLRDAQFNADRGNYLVARSLVLDILDEQSTQSANSSNASNDCYIDFSQAEDFYASIRDVVYYLNENELLGTSENSLKIPILY